MRREYWILIIISIFSLILRFASLVEGFNIQINFDMSLFPDEAFFLLGARDFFLGSLSPTYLYYHNSLILSPLISGLYSIFGTTAFAGRFISVLLSTLTIPVTYFLCKQIFKNEKKALLAAFLIGISFIHRFWSMRALADGPLTFFFILSIYLFVRAIQSEKWHWFLWAGLSTTITILIKYPGILIFLIIFAYILIGLLLKQISLKVLFYYLTTLVIFAFTIITLLLSQFALAFQPLDQIRYFLSILFSFSSNPLYYLLYTLFLNPILAITLLLFLVIVVFHAIRHHTSGDLLLICWAGIVFAFFSLFGESELYRYLLPAFPAVYILISHFLIDFANKHKFSIQKMKLTKNFGLSILILLLIGGFITAELAIGEMFIVKRSTSYGGIYQMSTWLNANGTLGAGIMAPSNSLAQLNFYTSGNFDYKGLSIGDTIEKVWIDVQGNNISYIILSAHFPETLSFPIYELISNTTYFSFNFSYYDGTFETVLYTVN